MNRRFVISAAIAFALVCIAGCAGSGRDGAPSAPDGRNLDGTEPVAWGEPIDVAALEGTIVFDDFEDVYTADANGTEVRPVTKRPGAEFDGALSPDGEWIVYRDSRRGINEDDEIYVARSDGSAARNITRNPGSPTVLRRSDRLGRKPDASAARHVANPSPPTGRTSRGPCRPRRTGSSLSR